MTSIKTPVTVSSSWFRKTIDYTHFNADAVSLAKTLIHDMKGGTIFEEVIIRPRIRFFGPNVGYVALNLVDEYDTVLLKQNVNIGSLVNPYSYYRVAVVDRLPVVKWNTAPDKLFARIAHEVTLTGETQLVTVTAGGASLGGKYFTISTAHYVWYDTGGSVDPAPGGPYVNPIVVNVLPTDSIEEVARKTYEVLANTNNVSASWGVNQVLITRNNQNVTDATPGTSGFVVVKELDGGGTPTTFDALTQGEVDIFLRMSQMPEDLPTRDRK